MEKRSGSSRSVFGHLMGQEGTDMEKEEKKQQPWRLEDPKLPPIQSEK